MGIGRLLYWDQPYREKAERHLLNMHKEARDLLVKLLHGQPHLWETPRLLEGYLRDGFGELYQQHGHEYLKEQHVLLSALKTNIATELAAGREGLLLPMLIGRLSQRLEDHFAMTSEAARWGVETWALALGKIHPHELKQQTNPLGASPEIGTKTKTGKLLPFTRKCPYCAEMIREDAMKCRFCGEFINEVESESSPVEFTLSPSGKLAPEQIQNLPPLLRNALGMEFVLFLPGTFAMGSPDDEVNRWDRELQHTVTLTRPYYLQTTPVTKYQWQMVMNENPSFFKGDIRQPVEQVSWLDCQVFIQKLNGRGEGSYRLPTEAEWEYACRSGSQTAYYFGNEPDVLGEHAWFRSNADEKTHIVGQKKPNIKGLYDLLGNVWEWCQDWYGEYLPTAQHNPTGPDNGLYRVLRGGSWSNYEPTFRSAFRNFHQPDFRSGGVGLRLLKQP